MLQLQCLDIDEPFCEQQCDQFCTKSDWRMCLLMTMVLLRDNAGLLSYGCGSKCKVWIKPRSHKRSRPLIQTPDPDLSKGVDPDL